LEQVKKQIGYAPEGLENPTNFPHLLKHVWSAFCELNNARQSGFSGPNALSYTEIKSWKELTESPLTSFDISLVKKLDGAYLRIANG
jgi:hypothetical protein